MTPPQPRPLEPQIWRACAGSAVQFPTVNSRVYYFPQGHMDQASSPPQHLSPLLLSRPYIPCTISAVQFLADPITDEVFVKLALIPVVDFSPFANPPQVPVAGNGDDDDDDAINSFVKILTPSDANNGGGFSVPRFCAESIFPPLNYDSAPPSQTLRVTDVQGKTWEFRHIYRGTPKRHLLTTGWNHFVNSKKLIAGDSVVFMTNRRNALFIGIRRVNRFSSSGNNGDGRRYYCAIGGVRNIAEEKENEKQQEENCNEGFSRNGKGKLSPESVASAAEKAALNMPFEVVYYPKARWSDFVVNAEAVNEALGIAWAPGMRVKMGVETDDFSRMTWYQGTISSYSVPGNGGPWPGSPWRMLQITWDEPEVLKNSQWVSPWQVERVPSLLAELPPTKKFRADDGLWMSIDEGGYPFSMTRFTNSTMEYMNQTLLDIGTSPAGMQGARHYQSSESSFSKFRADNTRLCIGESSGHNTVPNVGISQLDNLSLDSNSLPPLDAGFVPKQSCNSIKPGPVSFQLFGVVIQTEQPVESSVHVTGNIVDDSTKDGNETEGVDKLVPLDSLTYGNLVEREASGRVQTIIS